MKTIHVLMMNFILLILLMYQLCDCVLFVKSDNLCVYLMMVMTYKSVKSRQSSISILSFYCQNTYIMFISCCFISMSKDVSCWYNFNARTMFVSGSFDLIGSSHQIWHVIAVITFVYWHIIFTKSFLKIRTTTHCWYKIWFLINVHTIWFKYDTVTWL